MRPWPALLVLLLTACGGVAAPAATADPVTGNVSVFAAASLTEAFTKLGTDFHGRHQGATVQFNFAGSPTLVAQLTQGAQADVFASADEPNMAKVSAAGLTAGPARIFASNRLEIVVEAGNPKHITGLADLAQPGLLVVLAAPAVPAGRYAGQALQAAGVKVTPVSQEVDVKAVVSKVALGEADAGIVYLTDVRAGGAKVAGVPIPDADNVVARYPVALLKGAANSPAGQAFVDYLLGAEGQKTLAGFGFTGPS
jgi:molybdate transport system substrate-binding protein